MRNIIIAAILSIGSIPTSASAQTSDTWIYATNSQGGIAWNNSDLDWDETDKSLRGTFVTYVKTAIPMGDKQVSFILEDFHLKCSGPEYFYENVLYYDSAKKLISSMFNTKKVPIEPGSPYHILSEVLCKGVNFTDGKLLRNVRDTAEVMTRLAEG